MVDTVTEAVDTVLSEIPVVVTPDRKKELITKMILALLAKRERRVLRVR